MKSLLHKHVMVAGNKALDEFRQLARDGKIVWIQIPREALPEEAPPDCVSYQGRGEGYTATIMKDSQHLGGMIAGGSEGVMVVVLPLDIVAELFRGIESQALSA